MVTVPRRLFCPPGRERCGRAGIGLLQRTRWTHLTWQRQGAVALEPQRDRTLSSNDQLCRGFLQHHVVAARCELETAAGSDNDTIGVDHPRHSVGRFVAVQHHPFETVGLRTDQHDIVCARIVDPKVSRRRQAARHGPNPTIADAHPLWGCRSGRMGKCRHMSRVSLLVRCAVSGVGMPGGRVIAMRRVCMS